MSALEAVNAVLKVRDLHATVTITGGAAIMFQFPDFSREVKDLDGGYMSPELKYAVEQVTWEGGLQEGWFNDTSKDYYFPKADQTVSGPQFSNLSVELPSKDYLLCLKIMSGRPEEKANDTSDVAFMVKHMPNIKSEKDWQEMYVKFFGKNDWKPYTAEAARRAIEAKSSAKIAFAPGIAHAANSFASQYRGQEFQITQFYQKLKDSTSDWKNVVKYLEEAGLAVISDGWVNILSREEAGDKTAGIKTEKGTNIRRSSLGVGKDIGGAIYLHRQYKDKLPDQKGFLEAEQIAIRNGFKDYNAIKWSKPSTYTFIECVGFDTEDEPEVGDYITVKPDGHFKVGYSGAIWHHKWLWVMDGYTGFDVNASKERSRKWLSIPGIDFSRIGNREYWNRNVVPKIAKVAKAPYKLQEFEGFQILIGRSAIENDVLSFEVATPQDFWFHVAGVPGSHIIVRNPGNLKELPGPVLQQVKQLAIHNSKARGTSAEVHWGFAKNLSKPEGAADGEVYIANWKKV
jgi:hypothetical protein